MDLREFIASNPNATLDDLFYIVDHCRATMRHVIEELNGDELSDFMGEIAAAFMFIPNTSEMEESAATRLAHPLLMTISVSLIAEVLKKHAEVVGAFLSAPVVSIPPKDGPSTSQSIERNPAP